ncbi:hypothetical protein DES36_10384 [Alkalibaculum bacchi]|uniref:Uncharacterized protein n=1 Tax=Alkalibaculum bacchi TaxID=645887 RepID=A0A366IE11_9FIRM|nr:hypothetical protein [Alkalibaculum bacchi]RBP68323.1 hypothetical protein DES36_10384 [Alkalibaculum bacchi]
MATKSILKNINIKEKNSGRRLVLALENAKNKKSKEVTYKKSYSEISKDQIKEIFKVTDDNDRV